MQKDVTQGKSYCLTVYSVPCKVTAIGENNIEYTLLNVSETGQYLFIALLGKLIFLKMMHLLLKLLI